MRSIMLTFRSYSQLFEIRGARGFVVAGFVGRLPISMRTLASLLMVLPAYGSYTLAGAISSVVALSNAASAPLFGRLADRRSQSWVILVTLVVHVTGIASLILLTAWHAPIWALFVAAAVFGLSALPLGSLVRARWAALVGGTPRLQSAYALEAFIDDIIYLSGPPIVTVLAARLFPSAALLVVLSLVAIGWVALALQRSTQPLPLPRAEIPQKSTISESGFQALLLATFTLGAWLGSVNVAMVAFSDEEGNPSMGGVLIGLMVLAGSAAGLIYGGINWTTSLVRRLLATAVILGAGSLPLLIANSLWQMSFLALLAGIAISPMLVSMYSLLTQMVAKTAVTEGFGWFACSITIGLSLGTATSGYVVDQAGSHGAYLFVVACGTITPLIIFVTRRFLARTPHDPQSQKASASPTGGTSTQNECSDSWGAVGSATGSRAAGVGRTRAAVSGEFIHEIKEDMQ